MPTTSIDELCQSIESLVHEHLQAHRRQVIAAVERSFAEATKASAKPTKPKPRTTKLAKLESRRRRTEAEIMAAAERLYELVCERPGETMTTLATELGATPTQLYRPTLRLRRAHLIRSVGERSGTRYFPLVDGKRTRQSA